MAIYTPLVQVVTPVMFLKTDLVSSEKEKATAGNVKGISPVHHKSGRYGEMCISACFL